MASINRSTGEVKFTPEEMTLLFNAMGHMAGVYAEDAKTQDAYGSQRLRDQFTRQSKLAQELSDFFLEQM